MTTSHTLTKHLPDMFHKCLTFDFFNINCDHLFYLKYDKLKYILKIHYVINHITFDFFHILNNMSFKICIKKLNIKHLGTHRVLLFTKDYL
jgi:hypothetical protein